MTPTRSPGPKLGEMLEARGRLDREAIFRAMRHQRAAGGRIGTCLLELEMVAEDELLHLLADQAKVPFVEPDALRSVPEETIRLVPQKIARARRAIPVRASGAQLYVAMIDPHDIAAQDELSFVSGRRVRPQIATEVRVYEALARYYAVDIPSRFVKLLDRLNRTRYLWKGESGPVAAVTTPPATPPPSPYEQPAPPPVPPPPRILPAPATTAETPPPTPVAPAAPAAPRRPPAEPPVPAAAAPAPLPALPAPPPAEPPSASTLPPPVAASAPLPLAQAEARLAEPASRDDVAATLVELARGRCEAALMVIVRRQEAAGWRGAIAGRGAADVEGFRISMSEPSLFLALREGVPYYRGPLPPLRAHGPLAELLGESGRGEIFAAPLHVRRRLVAVLLVAESRAPFAPAVLDEIKRAAGWASAALETLVLRQKLQKG
jgi:hypothetical protein